MRAHAQPSAASGAGPAGRGTNQAQPCLRGRAKLALAPQALDRVLLEAGQRDMRVILSLSDYWGAFGAGQVRAFFRFDEEARLCVRQQLL